ncbi:hypothetical protein [Streptacidiphilus rugosus]|uniref:hypothetical protein n=1 Tax=Streptacidiphilus rugosus TaxID=405783 RepID=UPI0012FB8E47|nr:hypothetical protein [Streptacidiphilus rugosus]
MSAMDRVLIGFADALAAPESAFCLADQGYRVVAFARRGSRPALAAARSVEIVEVTAPETDADACVRDIADAVERYRPVAVLPLDDHALWACSRKDLAAPLAGPRGEAARFALDKREQIDAARAAGLAVPGREDAAGPWIVKPALAVVEHEGRLLRPTGALARDEDEIETLGARIDGPVLVQRAVTGVGEGVFGFATASGVRAWSGHRRIRMMNPRGSGSSACRSVPVQEPLREAAERLVEGIGWRGLFMVELLRDPEGTAWFMEVNGRTWGSMALAVRRGYPYPVWAVRQALDPGFTPEPPQGAPDLLCRHLGRELVHLAAVLRGPSGADTGRWPGRAETLRAVLPRRGDRWYNWRRGEAGVFIRDTYTTVAGQIRSRT